LNRLPDLERVRRSKSQRRDQTDQRSHAPDRNPKERGTRSRIDPPAHALPPLPPEAFSALTASIARHGVLLPPVVSAGPASPGEVADGNRRLAACRDLGIECPTERRPFASEAELRVFQLTANLHRRQLTVAQRIRLGLELEPWERKLAADRRAQAKGKRRGAKALPVDRPEEKGETRARVAAAVGLKPSTYARGAKVLREGSPELVAALEQGAESVDGAYRRLRAEQRRAEREAIAAALARGAPPLPAARVAVVICDPPWPLQSGALPYPTMSLEEIAALPVPDLLAEDACLWLWTTNAFLFEAYRIATEDWRLTYRTTLTWAKNRPGTGSWLRGQSEHCLLLSRGTPVLTLGGQTTLLRAKAREHSRKPDEFFALVESLCPGSKLELFACERRPGWQAWGAEPDRFSAGEAV
jgi:N6-adenosine-specific RNA methylase IME4/ParB-like chromosome segregation protein Spo0J